MKIITLSAAAALALSLAACGDNRTDVMQVPADGGQPVEVTPQQADRAQTQTALALGMSREQLEDADLRSASNVDLGDVEALVMDAKGQVTHLVVELDGPEDLKVQVPLSEVRAEPNTSGQLEDLTTDLTMEQLKALPRWTGQAQ